MTSPEMRASDSDRDRVAEALREHMAQGRLTVEEFNERLELLYNSKTYGELAKLTADLPATDLHSLPAQQPAAERRPDRGRNTGLKAAWAAWAAVSAINWTIWLIVSLTTFNFIYPWPLWVMGPWGAALLVATMFEDRRKR
jgi:Domain of unknown function (DUF1707).